MRVLFLNIIVSFFPSSFSIFLLFLCVIWCGFYFSNIAVTYWGSWKLFCIFDITMRWVGSTGKKLNAYIRVFLSIELSLYFFFTFCCVSNRCSEMILPRKDEHFIMKNDFSSNFFRSMGAFRWKKNLRNIVTNSILILWFMS